MGYDGRGRESRPGKSTYHPTAHRPGRLRAKAEGVGVERRWLVDVDSLYALRSSRPETRHSPANVHIPDVAAGFPDSIAAVLRELAATASIKIIDPGTSVEA